MTLQDYMRTLREQWLVVTVAMALGVILSVVFVFVRPAEYSARTTLYVSAQSGDTPQQAYQGAQLSEQRVASYTELVTSDRVLADVIADMALATTVDQLRERVSATSTLGSVLIEISATDSDAMQSANIVNAVAAVTTRLIDEIERPTAVGGLSPVAVRIVQPAQVPDRESSTSAVIVVAAGLFAGLGAGVIVALLRNSLDIRIKSKSQLALAGDVPVVGQTFFDPKYAERPLGLHTDPQGPLAEAYREIRTNLQYVSVDNPLKVIAFSSANAGEGKSTLVANLAIAQAKAGRRVLAIEADLRRPRLSELFGLDRSVGLSSVLTGRLPLTQAVQGWNGGIVNVLSSGPLPPNPNELLGSKQMHVLLENARNLFDVVLIDTPPVGPVSDALAIAPIADGVVLVCRQKKSTSSQVANMRAAFELVRASVVVGSVISMVSGSRRTSYQSYSSIDSKDSKIRGSGSLQATKLGETERGRQAAVGTSVANLANTNDQTRRLPRK